MTATSLPITLAILSALLAPLAAAQLLEDITLVEAGTSCSNFGNQVNIGSHTTCRVAEDDCTNWGNQVYIGSKYECAGDECPNYGVRIQIGSDVCGDTANKACMGSTCLNVTALIELVTDGTIVHIPELCQAGFTVVCATHLCLSECAAPTCGSYMALRLDPTGPIATHETAEPCLPGTAPLLRMMHTPDATLVELAWSDCIPEYRIGRGGGIIISCNGEKPCGINQEPICWTYRYACMQALVLVLNAYDRQFQAPDKEPSRCEGQPGWP